MQMLEVVEVAILAHANANTRTQSSDTDDPVAVVRSTGRLSFHSTTLQNKVCCAFDRWKLYSSSDLPVRRRRRRRRRRKHVFGDDADDQSFG